MTNEQIVVLLLFIHLVGYFSLLVLSFFKWTSSNDEFMVWFIEAIFLILWPILGFGLLVKKMR
jgi:hypothetical protein